MLRPLHRLPSLFECEARFHSTGRENGAIDHCLVPSRHTTTSSVFLTVSPQIAYAHIPSCSLATALSPPVRCERRNRLPQSSLFLSTSGTQVPGCAGTTRHK